MVNCHLGWSKVIWVGQRSLDLNGGQFDTFDIVIKKKTFAKALNLKVVIHN